MKQLQFVSVCDWHKALPEPLDVEATQERTNPEGRVNDLCNACAMVWDWFFPRAETIAPFFYPDVIADLFRAGRSPEEEKPKKRSTQLHIPTPPAIDPEEVERAAKPPPTGISRYGRWVDGVDQVICPLEHRTGSPKEYWVKLRDRGSHARSSHGILGPEVPYVLPDPAKVGEENAIVFTEWCHSHKVCAQAGGFGFPNEAALKFHLAKCQSWEPASDKDAERTTLKRAG